MYTITRPVSPVSPLSPAACLARRDRTLRARPGAGTATVEFVPDGFRPATSHGPRRALSSGFVRRPAALLVAALAVLGAGVLLGAVDAGAAPDPSVPVTTVPTAEDFTIDREALAIPSLILPPAPAPAPVADGRVIPGSVDLPGPDPEDPADPDRFRIDPDALVPVHPDLDGVVDAPPEPIAPVDDAPEVPPVDGDPATVPAPAGAAGGTPAGDTTDPATSPEVSSGRDSAVDAATAADRSAVRTEQQAPAGSLAFTGTNALAAWVGACLVPAGAAAVLLARSARRRTRGTA